MNNYKVYEQFFSKIVEDGNYRRRGKVFQTRNRFYYYDTGTGKVFECEKVVYEVLKKLQDTNEFGRLKELCNCAVWIFLIHNFLICNHFVAFILFGSVGVTSIN